MKKEEIHWLDWHRILIGSAPNNFLLEVLIRTAVIYLFLLVILRLMGKRMGGQLTISELSVMLTLGAIISVPMQVPDKGLLQGIVVLISALVFQRGISYLGVKSTKIERITQGHETMIVKNGVLIINELRAMNISREQIIAVLRNQKIYNLGEVRRVYIEACGLFSVFKYPEAKPGLCLLPPSEEAAGEAFSIINQALLCKNCGNSGRAENESYNICNNCGARTWTQAVIAK